MNDDYLLFLLISSAPMVLPLLVLTLGLLMLRRSRMKSRRRMIDSENHITGSSTTSWDHYTGPSTLSALPEPHNFDTSQRRADE